MNINGLNRFSRTITTRRAGTCAFCQRPTVAGTDYASVNAAGAWIAVCATCAISIPAQVRGVVAHAEALSEECDPTGIVLPTDDEVIAAMADNAPEAEAFRILTIMQGVVAQLKGRKPVAADPVIDGLRSIVATASKPKDIEFARSLLAWHDSGKPLSVRQRECAVSMIARIGTPSVPAVPTVVPDIGLYLFDTGRIVKLYLTQNDRLAGKVLHIIGAHGSFEFAKGMVTEVAKGIAAGTCHRMTQDEASAFGRLHSFCCNCGRDLDDERSLAVGYGPSCALRNNWYYPSRHEASDILARPVSVPTIESVSSQF